MAWRRGGDNGRRCGAVPPDGEIVLESTANGAAGCFYEEWQRAEQMGYSRQEPTVVVGAE